MIVNLLTKEQSFFCWISMSLISINTLPSSVFFSASSFLRTLDIRNLKTSRNNKISNAFWTRDNGFTDVGSSTQFLFPSYVWNKPFSVSFPSTLTQILAQKPFSLLHSSLPITFWMQHWIKHSFFIFSHSFWLYLIWFFKPKGGNVCLITLTGQVILWSYCFRNSFFSRFSSYWDSSKTLRDTVLSLKANVIATCWTKGKGGKKEK